MKPGIADGEYIFSGRNVPLLHTAYLGQHRQSRHSQHVNQQQPSNAFANLRNQISNLRQQFSKLIHKDTLNNVHLPPKDKIEKETRQYLGQRRQHRNSSQYQSETREGLKRYSQNQCQFIFKSKQSHGLPHRGPNQNISLQKKLQNLNEEPSHSRFAVPSTHQIQEENHFQAQQRIQKLVDDKKNLMIFNKKLEFQVQKMKNQLIQASKQHQKEVAELKEQMITLDKDSEQLQISLSIKDKLLQKMDLAIKGHQDQRRLLEKQYQTVKRENQLYKQKEIQLVFRVQELENDLNKQRLYEKKSPKEPRMLFDEVKISQNEVGDLRKRVQSYKKSLQNLNSTHNSTREKLALAKQELKQAQSEYKRAKKIAQELLEDNSIKQTLIISLYKDIGVLDKEMRQLPHLKSVIEMNSKSIEALNEMVMELQCQKLNYKYSLNPDYSV